MTAKRSRAGKEEQTDLLRNVDRPGPEPRNRRGRTPPRGLGGVIDWGVMFGDESPSEGQRGPAARGQQQERFNRFSFNKHAEQMDGIIQHSGLVRTSNLGW